MSKDAVHGTFFAVPSDVQRPEPDGSTPNSTETAPWPVVFATRLSVPETLSAIGWSWTPGAVLSRLMVIGADVNVLPLTSVTTTRRS